MQDGQWMPRVDLVRCTGCGTCVVSCPTGALDLQDGQAWLAYPDRCAYCALCETVCPSSAIELPYLVIRQSNRRAFS
jgi:ferredoxin